MLLLGLSGEHACHSVCWLAGWIAALTPGDPAAAVAQADEDGDEECGDDEGEDEEGFVVGDGYLSDDEGMRDEEEPLGEAWSAASILGLGSAVLRFVCGPVGAYVFGRSQLVFFPS
jgi:hypothetical protein